MHVETQVAASGPVVILIHGLGGSSFSWRAVVAELSKSRKTYAVDLPGFGQSGPMAGVNSMETQAAKLAKWIDAQGFPGPVTIIGHSMGGGISLYLADQAAAPGGKLKIDKMVLIAPAISGLPLKKGVLAEFSPRQRATLILKGIPELNLKGAYADPSLVEDEQIRGYAEGLSTKHLTAFDDHAENLKDFSLSDDQLKAIKTETLIIWGEEDTFVPPTLGTKLTAALGKASLEPIPECGHIPHEEKPAETIALIKKFLK